MGNFVDTDVRVFCMKDGEIVRDGCPFSTEFLEIANGNGTITTLGKEVLRVRKELGVEYGFDYPANRTDNQRSANVDGGNKND